MQRVFVVFLAIAAAAAPPLAAQRGGAPAGGRVTFAVAVADPSGAPITDVKVTMTGPAQRASRTEAGRLVFENLPSGSYHFRFEKDGFTPLDRDVPGKGSAPIDVKVTLSPVALPPRPVPTLPPPAIPASSSGDGRVVALDMPAFIEKNYVKRASGKTTPLACSAGGTSTLIQINDPIATHTHADADEFLYVIAGQGSANMGERQEALGPGVFLLIPRGVAHGFTTGPAKPLVMISTRAGEKCAG
jgi:mannose-6-phosphate isomerase-like protein (cupin superfamily)